MVIKNRKRTFKLRYIGCIVTCCASGKPELYKCSLNNQNLFSARSMLVRIFLNQSFPPRNQKLINAETYPDDKYNSCAEKTTWWLTTWKSALKLSSPFELLTSSIWAGQKSVRASRVWSLPPGPFSRACAGLMGSSGRKPCNQLFQFRLIGSLTQICALKGLLSLSFWTSITPLTEKKQVLHFYFATFC